MNGDARGRILAEARAAFAASGYDGAPLRSITKAAGVDVALVAYYFGNKEGLFREVVANACARGSEIAEAIEENRHTAGAEVTRVFGEILAHEQCRQVVEAVFRTVLSPNHDEDAMHVQVVEQLRVSLGRALGGAQTHPGDQIFAALFTGMFVMRYLLPIEPLASADQERLERVLALQSQEILDAVDDRGDHGGWGEFDASRLAAVVETEVTEGAAATDDVTTKDRILDAARRSFARLGYHGTALRDLANEVGCNVALIPYHFGSKLGLFEAVVGQGLQGTREIREALDARDPMDPESNAEAARRTARIIVDMFTKEPAATALRAVLLSAASPRDEHRQMHGDLMRMVHAAYLEAIGSGPFLAAGIPLGEGLTAEEEAEAELAFLLFGTIPVGVFVLRDLIGLEPLASVPVDDFVELLAPRLEWLLNGGLVLALRRAGGSQD